MSLVIKLSPARLFAHEILYQQEKRQAYVKDLLASHKKVQALSDEDKAFCHLLCSGVVACKGVLDELYGRVLEKKTKIERRVRIILRICAYELYFLKKDAYSAVSQSVELAKRVSPKASSFVNWVCRRMAKNCPQFPFGDQEQDKEAFCRLHGFSFEFFSFLEESIGPSRTRTLIKAQDSPAPLFVTSLPSKISEDELEQNFLDKGIIASPLLPLAGSWLIQDPAKFIKAGFFEREGLIAMDYSAQVIAAIAAGKGTGTILEVGAGRGTKTAVILARSLRQKKFPHITALDIHAFKAELSKTRLHALGMPEVKHVTADASQQEDLNKLGSFETIFLDAPCSGSGTLRRNPELIWSFDSQKIKALTQLQLKMLKALSSHVQGGGELIYSTCSVLPQENERLVASFLQSPEGKAFACLPVYERDGLSAAEAKALKDHCTPDGFLQSFPVEGGADGHFCARLVKVR